MTTSAGAQTLPAGAAPKTMLIAPPAPLLPETLGKLKRVSAGDAGDGLGLVDAADASVLTEDGLRRFARSEYADGPQHGSVTVYKFMDVSGAVAAFDYFRRPGLADAAKLGDEKASGTGSEVVFRSGVNVVRESFILHGDRGGALMAELIDHLPKASGAAGIAPMHWGRRDTRRWEEYFRQACWASTRTPRW